ncbi:hypothetical protein [Curtobacterium sp. NPDC086286]|jgi:mRNA interferase HicA|uniref:hypothetical protein n=1 Tax=Curtobacterium sp. NPDC086286 TaxID=3363964 RepID=UPI003803757A
MKQSELIKSIKQLAKAHQVPWIFDRHGGDHDIYKLDGKQYQIPRHREINERLARGMIKEAKDQLGA